MRALFFHFLPGLLLFLPAFGTAAQPLSFLEERAIFSADSHAFAKWNGMLTRYASESRRVETGRCGNSLHFPCAVRLWRRMLARERGRPLSEQLRAVNDFANAFPYTPDPVNWGVRDYWETPYEFLSVSGNCKDYAIMKYFSLRALGLPARKLRLIVLEDLNQGGVIHAVLGVYAGKKMLILDNQIRQVANAREIYHYLPLYGINETGWWRYIPRANERYILSSPRMEAMNRRAPAPDGAPTAGGALR